MRQLVRRMLAAFPTAPVDRDEELARTLVGDRGLRGATWFGRVGPARVRRWLIPTATMLEVSGPPAGFLHSLRCPSPADLAAALGLRPRGALAWLADERRMNAQYAL